LRQRYVFAQRAKQVKQKRRAGFVFSKTRPPALIDGKKGLLFNLPDISLGDQY
jgi:hypothetical protein